MDERLALQAMLHSELASDDEPESAPSSDSDDHLDVRGHGNGRGQGRRRSFEQQRDSLTQPVGSRSAASRPWGRDPAQWNQEARERDRDRDRLRDRDRERERDRDRMAEEQAAQAAQQLLHARAVAAANPNNAYPPRFDRHIEQATSYQQRAAAIAAMQAAANGGGGAAAASAARQFDPQPLPVAPHQQQQQQQQQLSAQQVAQMQQQMQMQQDAQRRIQELQAQQARIQQAQQAQQQQLQQQQQQQQQQQLLQQEEYAAYSPVHSKHPSASSGSGSGSSGTALDDLLRCFICYGRVVAPHLCPSCSKIGCKACYTTWISERGKSECPFCRSHLTLDRLVNCRWMSELTTALGEMGVMDQRDKAGSKGGNASCATHPSQSLSYYCLTCSTPLCSDCALFDSAKGHKGHEFAKLDAIYAEHVELVSVEKSKVAVRLAALVSRNDSVSRNISVLTRKKDEASHDLGVKVAEMEASLSRQLKTKLAALQSQKVEIGRESQMLSALLSELAQQLDPAILPKHRLIEKTAGILNALYEMQSKPSLVNGASSGGGAVGAGGAASSPSAASAASAEGLEGHEQALAASVAASVLGAESPPNVEAGFEALPGAAGSFGSATGASALHFQSELVPEWVCSPLVRVGSFLEKRRLAANEEEQIKLMKTQQMQMAQQAHQMSNGNGVASGGAEGEAPLLPPMLAPQHEVLYSAPLWSNGQCWRLKLYPNGNGIAKPSYISLFVELTFSHLKNPLGAAAGAGMPIAGESGFETMMQDGEASDAEDDDSVAAAESEAEEAAAAAAVAAAAAAAASESEEGKHDDSLPPLPGLKLPPQPPAPAPHAFNLFPPRSSASASGSKSALLSGQLLQNKCEYRVELLPHPSHFPDIADHLSLAILARADAADSPLRCQTVASYLEGLQYVHAHDSKLCAALAAYQSKIVSRVFSSNFEHGEAWGYNRFYRIDLLGDEGYLGFPEHDDAAAAAASAAEAASPGGAAAAASAASASAAAPASASKGEDDDEILFRFYIRPPSTYLLSLESRAWIAHLEQHAHRQARVIRKLQRQARKTKQQQQRLASPGASTAASPSVPASRSVVSVPRTTSEFPSDPAADRRGAGVGGHKISAPIMLRSAALKPAIAAAADSVSTTAAAAAPAPRSSPSTLPPSSAALQLSRAESEERDRGAALQLHAQLNDSHGREDEGAAHELEREQEDEEEHEEHEPLDHDQSQRHALHADLQLDDMQSSDSEASDGEEEEGGGDDELIAAIASAGANSNSSAAAPAPTAAPSNSSRRA